MQRPSLHHDNNTCPYCYTHLPVRLCSNGSNSRKRFLMCHNDLLHPTSKPYWHFWTLEESLMFGQPPPALALPTQSQQHPRAATVATPTPPSAVTPISPPAPAQPSASAKSSGGTCWERGCKSTRVHPQCMSLRCKTHCIDLNKGACSVKKHSPAFMSKHHHHATAFKRRRSTTPALLPDYTASEMNILEDIRLMAAALWEIAPVVQRACMHENTFPHIPPDVVDDLEARDVELAIQLSLSPDLQTISAASLPTSTPQASTSWLPTSSSSSTLPSSSASNTSNSHACSAGAGPDWMKQATRSGPPGSPDATFNVRQPSGRRAAVDPATIQRFTLVYWDNDQKAPMILGVEECPSWPNFRLAEAPQTLALLGDNIGDVEFYEVCFRLWIRVGLRYTHVLTPNTYLLVRRYGVTSGLNEAALIDQFVHLPGPQHIRYNLPAEREVVRKKLRSRRCKQERIYASDDSEVEVITLKSKSAMKQESDTVVLQRPVLQISTEGSVIAPINVDDDSPPPSSTSVFSAFPSSYSSRATTPSTTPTTPLDAGVPEPRWPADMYTVDMANGFLAMESPENAHLSPVSPAARFQSVFNTSRLYVPNTYRDQRRRWALAPESLRTMTLAAGRWSVFAKQVPLK
ncbi:hypothetical protein FB451DRAFT_1412387 [Mycena latifolia]|nr:hypothetical protein FB451DRAFT_1412387 [Mycena latifolia]